jgi:hypothetical protein
MHMHLGVTMHQWARISDAFLKKEQRLCGAASLTLQRMRASTRLVDTSTPESSRLLSALHQSFAAASSLNYGHSAVQSVSEHIRQQRSADTDPWARQCWQNDYTVQIAERGAHSLLIQQYVLRT